jgi:hypothetical protein
MIELPPPGATETLTDVAGFFSSSSVAKGLFD